MKKVFLCFLTIILLFAFMGCASKNTELQKCVSDYLKTSTKNSGNEVPPILLGKDGVWEMNLTKVDQKDNEYYLTGNFAVIVEANGKISKDQAPFNATVKRDVYGKLFVIDFR